MSTTGKLFGDRNPAKRGGSRSKPKHAPHKKQLQLQYEGRWEQGAVGPL